MSNSSTMRRVPVRPLGPLGLASVVLLALAAVEARGGQLRDLRDVLPGDPIELDGATVYPLIARAKSGAGAPDPIGLAQALARGQARVEEQRDGRILVTNRGPAPLWIPGGQILRGGSQDRIVVFDLVLPPKGEDAVVWVLCAEQGRSDATPGGNRLRARAEMATPRVRMAATVFQSQRLVWTEIDKVIEAAKARSATRAYPGARSRRRSWISQTAGRLDRALRGSDDVVGLALAVDGTLRTVELFGTPDLFEVARPAVVDSLALGARVWLDQIPAPRPNRITGFDLQRFALARQTLGRPRQAPGCEIHLVAGQSQSIGVEVRLPGGALLRSSFFSGRPKTGGLGLKDPEDAKRRRRTEQTERPERRPPPPSVTNRHGRGRTTPRPKPTPPRGGGR